jgi:hypothetical protein
MKVERLPETPARLSMSEVACTDVRGPLHALVLGSV